MDFDFPFEATIDIKPEELKRIITEFVEKSGKIKVISIDFSISNRSMGHGANEYNFKEFSAAKVKVQPVKNEVD